MAYGTNDFWHVQLEPESWAVLRGSCSSSRGQPFELRFAMTPGLSYLVITTAAAPSPILFKGNVPLR